MNITTTTSTAEEGRLEQGPFPDVPNPPTGIVMVSLNPVTGSDGLQRLALVMDDSKSPIKVVGRDEKTKAYYLAVEENCDIVINLDPKMGWYFDDLKGALTMKIPADKVYYRISYGAGPKPQDLTLHAKWTGIPPREAGPKQCHPFNLYVMFEQPEDGTPLRVCIDPDVKNPPPV